MPTRARVVQACLVLLALGAGGFGPLAIAQQDGDARKNAAVDWYARLECEEGESQREAYEAILAAPVVDEAALRAILNREARGATDRKAFDYVAEICGRRRLGGMAPALVKMANFTSKARFPWESTSPNIWESDPRRYRAVGALIRIRGPAIPAIIDGLRESSHLSRSEERFMLPKHYTHALAEICGERAAIRRLRAIYVNVNDPTEREAIDQCIGELQGLLRSRGETDEAGNGYVAMETLAPSATPQGISERGTDEAPVDWYARLESEGGELQREAYEAILAAPVVNEAALTAILNREARGITDRKAFAYVAEICGKRRLAGMAPTLVKMANFTGDVPNPLYVDYHMAYLRPRGRFPALDALIRIGASTVPAIVDGLHESCHIPAEKARFMPPSRCALLLVEILGEPGAIRKLQAMDANASDPTEREAIEEAMAELLLNLRDRECIAYLQRMLRDRGWRPATNGDDRWQKMAPPLTPQEVSARATGNNALAPRRAETATLAASENPFSTRPDGGNAKAAPPGMTVRPVPPDLRGADTPTTTPQPPGSARSFADPLALLGAVTLLATLLLFVVWFARGQGAGLTMGSPPTATSPPAAPPPLPSADERGGSSPP